MRRGFAKIADGISPSKTIEPQLTAVVYHNTETKTNAPRTARSISVLLGIAQRNIKRENWTLITSLTRTNWVATREGSTHRFSLVAFRFCPGPSRRSAAFCCACSPSDFYKSIDIDLKNNMIERCSM